MRIRKELGLSRAELGRRTATDARTLWDLEHDREVSDRVRLLVAAALGLQVFPPVETVGTR